jgi:uridine kinase
MLQIFCKNTGTTKSFPEGSTLLDILSEFEFPRPYPIVSAKVNNVAQGLKYRAYHNKEVEFVDVTNKSGMRVYTRSLCFVLYKAASDLFPDCKLYMEHPISNGYFCELHKADGSQLTDDELVRLRARMQEIIDKDIPFRRYEVQLDEAVRIFRDRGFDDKVKLLETSQQVYMDYYSLGDTVDYYYGRLLPSAGYLTVWGLEHYHNGLLLRIPDRHNPTILAPFQEYPKTFEVFAENLRWNNIMGLSNVGDVNLACLSGHASELIQVAEALQEKKIVQIAEEIDRRFRCAEDPVRIVLISGPSSSGKTTFCKRLSIQLKACGLRPISFSTDDYFVNRADTPRLPDGTYDFDNFDTVDHVALEDDLLRLLVGEEVEVPEYNFVTGIREYNGKCLRLIPDTVLLIEGIHALNPALTGRIADSSKFRIYISTLTSTSLDDHNWIPTRDNRLLRRIVRDYKKGIYTARETIAQWPSVCAAEEKWIFPYQENADVMFNSAYLIEFAVLRNHAEPILASVPKNCPEYSEAYRLLRFIHYFTPVSDKEIPPTSMLREFVGGSSFRY